MNQISTLFAHKVVNAVTADGPQDNRRRRDLLESVGIDPDAPVDPKAMISDIVYYDLCERVMRADSESCSLPLRVGSSMSCDDYGAFGLAWKSAPNLRGSYESAGRYGKVLTSVSTYELRRENGRNYMMLHRDGERRLGLRVSNEQTISAIAQISREVCQDLFDPQAVFFRHAAPDNISFHEAYFGCPVHFDSDRDALQVSDHQLEVPNRLGDPGISSFFDSHLQTEVAELPDDNAIDQRVHHYISKSLSGGIPTITDVAGQIGMSGRSLQRKLAATGRTFQDLVDDCRRTLAQRLLAETDYALAEIAFLTGFSDQSAFTRAFRRWAGETPRSWRLNARPGNR